MYLTNHARTKLHELNATESQVQQALAATPYPSRNHPGQWRYCAAGLCLVVDGETVVTAYLDRVLTPLRPDQIAAGVTINRR